MPDQPIDKKAPPEKGAAGNNKVINGGTKLYNFSGPSKPSPDQHPDAGAGWLDKLAAPDDFTKAGVNGSDHSGPAAGAETAKALAMRAVIRFDSDIPEARPVIQIRCGNTLTTFATLKNFSLIIGKAKSKKTFFVVLLLAGFFQGRAVDDKIHCITYPGKNRIVIFDTEQADFHVQRMLKRLMAAAGLKVQPYTLEVFCLRPYSTQERRQIIEHVLYDRKDIAVAIIDGIRDLITDINSAEEATNITGLLMKWTHDLNIHIINVLHQNKSDLNARGHAGAELTNKAESVLSTRRDTRDKSVSVVTPEYFRDRDFKPFGFSVDEAGLPYVIDAFEPAPYDPESFKPGQKNKSALSFDEIPKEIHCLILMQVFGNGERLSYKETIPSIKAAFEANKKKMGNSAVIDIFSMYKYKGWIIQEKGLKGHPVNFLGELPC